MRVLCRCKASALTSVLSLYLSYTTRLQFANWLTQRKVYKHRGVLLIPFEEDLAPCSFLKILYRTFSSAESSLENDASYLALSIALKTDSIETSSSNLLNTRTYWLYVKMATFVFSFEISKSLTRSLANFLVFPNTSSDTLPELSSRITMSIFSWHLNSAPMDQNCCYILF